MTARLLFLSVFVFPALPTQTVLAELPTDRAIIPGYERFRESSLTSVEAGRLLLSELNCTSCHQGTQVSSLPNRKAPILTNVAQRIQPGHLEQFIANPSETKPGTAMPSVWNGASAKEKAKAIAHFLNQNNSTVPIAVSEEAVSKGEALFHTLGCAACHGDRRQPPSKLPAFAMPLGKLHEKYTLQSLTAFLQNPHAVRPSGRMPGLNLEAKEADWIASYLLRETDADPVIEYEYFEGGWQTLPDFSTLAAKTKGYATTISVSVAEKKNQFGLRFTSNLHLTESGPYQFWLRSDDGSRLLIDGQEVIKHDGIHPASDRNTSLELTAGPHQLIVEYFEGGGEEELSLEFKGPGINRQPVTAFLSLSAEGRTQGPSYQVDPALVQQGAELFVSTGCASCHQHEGLAKTSPPGQSKPLTAINPLSTSGCLAGSDNAPRFQLSVKQINDLKAAIADLQTDPATARTPDPESHIQSTLLTLNCFACHSRNDMGGTPSDLNHVFEGTVPEMGDEARIPPTLTQVGDKLQTDWMQKVLNEGAKNRPYMKTRMPRFGKQNVGRLVEQFAAVDAKNEIPVVEFTEPPHRVLSAGRYMVGGQALGCIKCHTFGKYQATGIQSLDMTTMTKRLRRDWFHRYLVDPQKYRKGTRMPSAWPNGKSILKNVLDRNTPEQIQAIWDYLDQGEKAAIPYGLERKAIVLTPEERPIIYRNFIEGLSPRGIAVGHPEKVHYAWDAHDMNLKLIWHNQFIDASKHWVGRGPGFQSPLGDHVMNLPGGIPLARLESLDGKWPTGNARENGFRFLGYSLDPSGLPTFKYEFDGITITDHLSPVEAEPDSGLQRQLELQTENPEASTLYFRIAAGANLTSTEAGFTVDSVTYRGQLNNAVIRDTPEKNLLIPIQFDQAGRAKVHYQMHW